MRNKDDTGDGVPTDQLQHNHCDCTGGHCSNHTVASCVCASHLNPCHKTTTAGTPSTMSSSPSSSTRASLVSSVKTFHKATSQDRHSGLCWESVKMIQVALSHAHHTTSRPPLARSCSWVWSSTWPRFWVCFFLGLDEHAADDEQARTPGKLHEQA